MACAGKFLTSSSLLAPTYCDIIEEMALRDCPNTHISMDKNVVTTPTAANDSVAFRDICPTIAASVSERIGSEIPAIIAGIASVLICLRLMFVFKSLFSASCFSYGSFIATVLAFQVRFGSFFCVCLLDGFITKKFTAHNRFVQIQMYKKDF